MPIEQVQRSRSKRKQKQKQNKSQSKISYFFIVFRAYIYGETLLWMYDAVWPFFGRHLERYLSYILLVFVGSFLRPDFFFLFSSFFIYLILLLFECCTYFCFTWVSNLIWYSFFTLNLLSFVFKCAPPPPTLRIRVVNTIGRFQYLSDDGMLTLKLNLRMYT